MASSASDLIKFEKQANGENSGTWGTLANTAMSRLEEAIAGYTAITMTGANYTLDDTQYVENSGTTAESHLAMIKVNGTPGASYQVVVPLRTKFYEIWNNVTTYDITVGGSTGDTVTIPNGYIARVFCDGTNVELVSSPVTPAGLSAFIKGADIASASPLVIGTDGDMFDVTGTTGFSTMTVTLGRLFMLQFDGALTMTHGAGTLDLPGAANITTAAGDTALCYSTTANVVNVLAYKYAAGGPAATATSIGMVELAIASELNTGTDAGRAVTPDALAGSNYGTAVVPLIPFNSITACATGDHAGSITFRVPSILNGFNLVGVAAANNTAGTTGTMDIQVHNITQTADMLTTKITIDSGETDSSTAATAAVIDAANDDVATGDQIRVDVDAIQTTPATGLMIELQFRLP